MGAVDHRVRIPMSDGVDSLNVAAAAAVACYALLARSRTEVDD
jgi:tRNA G18 (ribose-2'-O)-methylase SpoU